MKEKYICSVPFSSLEIQERNDYLCCPSWLKMPLPKGKEVNISWNSSEANKVRDSILDGSYKYCDSKNCPYLSQLEKIGNVGKVEPLFHRDNLPSEIYNQIKNYKQGTLQPEIIQLSFDRTCNLKCPTCRLKIYTADKRKIEEVESIIEDIQNKFGNNIKTLYITGSGDPFISVGFRNFLRSFNKKNWPNLVNIHLHTNATKWNKKMWDSMKAIHPYVKSCEISIDAATKETYENKTRIGGDWGELLDNLKFIATIKSLKKIKTSFVVQQKNYSEMKMFYDLMLSIFGHKVNVYYGKVLNWGTYTQEQFDKEQIWNITHPEYKSFIKAVNGTLPATYAWSNLQEYIIKAKSTI